MLLDYISLISIPNNGRVHGTLTACTAHEEQIFGFLIITLLSYPKNTLFVNSIVIWSEYLRVWLVGYAGNHAIHNHLANNTSLCQGNTRKKHCNSKHIIFSLMQSCSNMYFSLASNFDLLELASISFFVISTKSESSTLCWWTCINKKLTHGITQINFTHCKLERDFSDIAVVTGNMKYNRISLLTSQNIIWWYLTASWHLILVTF